MLLWANGLSATHTPTAECAYLTAYFGHTLLPSLTPSIRNECISALNAAIISRNVSGACIPQCQSLHTLYAQCVSSSDADSVASGFCGKAADKMQRCSTLSANDTSLVTAVQTTCKNSTFCTSSCIASITALEQASGCCRHDVLNGPKALCGQRTIAPCSTVLNNNSSPAPSSECAYLNNYFGSVLLNALTPSLSDGCRAALNTAVLTGNYSSVCTPQCRSLQRVYARCKGVVAAEFDASTFCASVNNSSCSSLLTNGSQLISRLGESCSNSTECSSSCRDAINTVEQYGGCCFSHLINGAKALCGQTPIASCSTAFGDH